MPTGTFAVTGSTPTTSSFEIFSKGTRTPYPMDINEIAIPPVPSGAADNVYIQVGPRKPPQPAWKIYVKEADLPGLRMKQGKVGTLTYWLGSFLALLVDWTEGDWELAEVIGVVGVARYYEVDVSFKILGAP